MKLANRFNRKQQAMSQEQDANQLQHGTTSNSMFFSRQAAGGGGGGGGGGYYRGRCHCVAVECVGNFKSQAQHH